MDQQTASILINLVDGTRQNLSPTVKWSARIHDSRSPSEWRMINADGNGTAMLVNGLTYFDNLFDN